MIPSASTGAAPWLTVVAAVLAGGMAQAAPALDAARLEPLEREAAALIEAAGDSEEGRCALLVSEARASVAAEPDVAAVLFNVALRLCLNSAARPRILVEAGRAEALLGSSELALEHLAQAAEVAGSVGDMGAAVESFVRLAEKSGTLGALPPFGRYASLAANQGRMDDAAYEVLYRLGRMLALSGDRRAGAVLRMIPADALVARRALYVLGTVHLRAGDRDGARKLFAKAAALPQRGGLAPEEATREERVLELAWLAVGRLAFEQGDAETGFYAYHQVLVHSPDFSVAFLELGWLAMEQGKEDVALLAFEPLIGVDPEGDVGRRAALLKGYVMLRRKQYEQAREHYEAIATRYSDAVAQLDAEVAGIVELADLARDCAVRSRALATPRLTPVMHRRELELARRLGARPELLARELLASQEQLRAVEALLAGKGARNPLARLSRKRAEALALVQRIQAALRDAGLHASRASWSAGPAGAQPACCAEPLDRLAKLRTELETLVLAIDDHAAQIRTAAGALRRQWRGAAVVYAEEHAALSSEVLEEQRRLAAAAVGAVRRELHGMAMEGDAGVLEAIWRYKEDHLEQIKALERERKQRLDELIEHYEEALAQLEEDAPL